MRHAASIAALALLLGACTVQLEGAPCGSDAKSARMRAVTSADLKSPTTTSVAFEGAYHSL